jgi:cbb3-type cytochrome oxidase subunit 3
MKKFRVILYVGEDKQWVFAYGKNKKEAIENAVNSISVVSAEEVDEDEY